MLQVVLNLQLARQMISEAEVKKGTCEELDKAWWHLTKAIDELNRSEEK